MEENEKPKSLKFLHMFPSFFTDESAQETASWVALIQEVLGKGNESFKNISDTYGNLGLNSLGGFYAEAHQAVTLNVNAVVKQTGENVIRLGSTEKSSPDLLASWGDKFSLKFNKDAKSSLYEQSKAHTGDLEGLPRYHGMDRIIPADQLKEAKTIADQRIERYSDSNPALANRYQETKDHLDSQIVSPEGAQSTPLTKAEANQWAEEAKKGKVHELGFSDSVTFDDCLEEIGQAAGSAALINASIQVAPIVIGSLNRLFKDPDYGSEKFWGEIKNWAGEKGIQSSFDTFVKSSVAASLSLANKAGLLEGPLQGCHPSFYAALAITSVEAAKKLWLCATKQCTGEEAANHVFKSGLKTSATLTGKVFGQTFIPIPIIGGVVGALVASSLADFGLDSVENSTAITLIREIDKHYGINKETLKRIFEVDANYNEIFRGYQRTILTNNSIVASQLRKEITSNDMDVREETIIDQNGYAINDLSRRQNLLNELGEETA